LRAAELADRLAVFPRYRRRGHHHRPLAQNSKNAARDGPDAVLVAGSGLIIRLRKDIVGSTPTRPTKESRKDSRDRCAVKHKVATWTRYALFPDGTHFALSGNGGSVESFVRGAQP
jgi:hypothetical protein